MGEVLDLTQYCVEGESVTGRRTGSRRVRPQAQIVIFPGVRVERHTIDLAARFVDVAGRIAGVRESDNARRI